MRSFLLVLLSAGLAFAQSPHLRSNDGNDRYLGNLNGNRYDPNSVNNRYGQYGSRYSPDSINNRYGVYGSRYSPYSPNNRYTTTSPKIVTSDGQYLGNLGGSPFGVNSTSNRFGQYGSRYSPNSINNPYGAYGSPYFPQSIRNRSATGSSLDLEPLDLELPMLPMRPSLPKLELPSLWEPE